MKVLITGSSGFIGRHLVADLYKKGWSVTAPMRQDIDLTRDNVLSGLPYSYDYIFHLAAWTEAGDFCLEHPGDQWIINQKINTNVLSWWKEKQPQAKMIAIGSSCSYEPGPDRKESEYMSGEPHESLYAYAMTKRMLYEGCRALAKQCGLKYLYVIPSAVYGADYHKDGRKAHFIFDITKKIIRGKEFGADVVLWGDGLQWREVVYVDDFIAALLLLNEKYENDIFNIGSGDANTIRYFAERVCGAVGYDPALIIYDSRKYVGSKVKYLCEDKMRKALPDYSFTDLDGGIDIMVDWFYKSGAWKI